MENFNFKITMFFLSLATIVFLYVDLSDAAPMPGGHDSYAIPYLLTSGLIAMLLQHG